MSPLTPIREEISLAIGLNDTLAFTKKIKQRNIERQNKAIAGTRRQPGFEIRGTGRSTQMLVNALVVMTRGLKVTIKGYTPEQQEMFAVRLKGLAAELGISPKLVVKTNADVVFVDHSVYGP